MSNAPAEMNNDLSSLAHRVLREKETEPAFSGTHLHSKEKGAYRCAGCGALLFASDTKFDSGTGWPSFTDPAVADAVRLIPDDTHGMHRTEVVCAKCGGHLGHVFDDGPMGAVPGGKEGTGKRYCINSICLALEKKDGEKE